MKKTAFYLIIFILAIPLSCGKDSSGPELQDTYAISGVVTGADDVTIHLSGDATATWTIQKSGDTYSFTVATGGVYTVTPSKGGYEFTPANVTIQKISANTTQNFEAKPASYTISGTVSGADSVLITLSGGSSATWMVNNGGTYSFPVSAFGSYMVTPSKTGYVFTPESITFNNITGNHIQNFEAKPLYVISGTIIGADSVTVMISGDASGALTVNNGEKYSFIAPARGAYTIIPSKQGYSFTPDKKEYGNLSGNQTQDFTAKRDSFTITGAITGADEVTVTLSGDASASQIVKDGGIYSFTVEYGGSYIVTPSKTGYHFSPSNFTVNNISAGQTQNFNASQKNHMISGTIAGAAIVTIRLSGDKTDARTVMNDGDSYSFAVGEGGSYTITPSKIGYTFNPASKTFTNIDANQVVNFTATQITYTITGTVSGADGITLFVTGDGAASQTVNNGETYSFTVVHGGNYTITPEKTGYAFTPASKSFTNIASNQSQNFTAAMITFTLTGSITGADGVTVTLRGDASGSQTVNSGGSYSFTAAYGGSYTVTPSKIGYFFSPANASFANITSNQMQHFTGYQIGKIAFILNGSIYSINSDGSNKIQLTFNTLAENPTWSPDGSKIYYQITEGGASTHSDIYYMNTDDKNIVVLTNSANNREPAMSPDGSQIAFVSNRDGTDLIYLMNPDGTNQRRFFTEMISTEKNPSWSPDGSKIVYSDGHSIYIADKSGLNRKKITSNTQDQSDQQPSISPDGQYIAFMSNKTDGKGANGIFIMNIDGSNIRQITFGGDHRGPSWSPDGQQIAFWSTFEESTFLVDVKSKVIQKITDGIMPEFLAKQSR